MTDDTARRPMTATTSIQFDLKLEGEFYVARMPAPPGIQEALGEDLECPVLATCIAPAFHDVGVREAFGELLARILAVALKDAGATVLAAYATQDKVPPQ